ncbi:MAG: hypothetical protein ACHRHE_08245 [Tepidisphaerales bacterium]
MKVLATILLCILAAVCYGIVHDQVTARICVEYFTIGHPPVFLTDCQRLAKPEAGSMTKPGLLDDSVPSRPAVGQMMG